MTNLEKTLAMIDLQGLLDRIEFIEKIYKEHSEENYDEDFYRNGLSALEAITNCGSYKRLQELYKNGEF